MFYLFVDFEVTIEPIALTIKVAHTVRASLESKLWGNLISKPPGRKFNVHRKCWNETDGSYVIATMRNNCISIYLFIWAIFYKYIEKNSPWIIA